MEDEKAAKEDHRSKLSRVLESIASIFQPIIPAITGAGLLKAFMALFVTLGWLDNTTQTYTILNAFADSAFYFLPILLGASAARSFKCNQYVAMALGGVLVYPQFITLLVLPAYIGGDGMGNLVNACIGTVIAMVVSFIVCFVLYSVWQKQGKLDESETNA